MDVMGWSGMRGSERRPTHLTSSPSSLHTVSYHYGSEHLSVHAFALLTRAGLSMALRTRRQAASQRCRRANECEMPYAHRHPRQQLAVVCSSRADLQANRLMHDGNASHSRNDNSYTRKGKQPNAGGWVFPLSPVLFLSSLSFLLPDYILYPYIYLHEYARSISNMSSFVFGHSLRIHRDVDLFFKDTASSDIQSRGRGEQRTQETHLFVLMLSAFEYIPLHQTIFSKLMEW